MTARTGPRQGRSASHATGLRPALDPHRPAPTAGIYRGEGEERPDDLFSVTGGYERRRGSPAVGMLSTSPRADSAAAFRVR
jgi:hypothetical protein